MVNLYIPKGKAAILTSERILISAYILALLKLSNITSV